VSDRPSDSELLSSLSARWDAVSGTVYEVHEYIHATVEPSGEEHACSERLCVALDDNGFQVTRPLAGLPTAFAATPVPAEANGVRVALLCEYDGLPPYGQSCGHNVVSGAALGAGLLLAPCAREFGLIPTVIGTPAEEGFGGKRVLADAGVFAGMSAALLVYPGMDDIADSRTLCAQGLEIVMTGRAAHAAAHPELGANALDALLAGYLTATTLRPSLHPHCRFHGIITEGGVHAQVVPERAVARVAVRAPDRAMLDEVRERVVGAFRGAAEAHGVAMTTALTGPAADAVRPNSPLAGVYGHALELLGRAPRPRDVVTGAWTTDAGYLSRFVPVLQPQVQMTARSVSAHSMAFHEASRGAAAEAAIRVSAIAMAFTAVQLASDPALRQQVAEAWGTD
jgi:amidohydrolase